MKWKNKGHEFDEVAKKICKKNQDMEYYIYGAGVFGIAFYDLYKGEIHIRGFIDDDPEKQKKTIKGIRVYCLNDILSESRDRGSRENMTILVSSSQTKKIYGALEAIGLVKHETYFHIDEFAAIYMMYKHNKLYFPDIVYTITERCTLRCKGCNAFIPDVRDKKDYPMDVVCRDFDAYFHWVDFTNVVSLMGGDAMLHPEFTLILEYICDNYYPDQIGNVEIYGNAIIIPDLKLLELMKKYDIIYRFTDYRPYTVGKQKIEKIKEILEIYQIRYDHIRLSSWWDCGYPQESNNVHGEEKLQEFFDACDRHACHNLSSRGILFCGSGLSADRVNYCKADEDDFFDISVYDENRRRELMEFSLGYSKKGYLAYCEKCNGSVNVNDKWINAGEQI